MNQNPFEKVTEAVLHPEHEQGRTRELLEPSPTRHRKLLKEADSILWELEELNVKGEEYMPPDIRVRLLRLLIQCSILPENIPMRTMTGMDWTFRAQAELRGLDYTEE